MTTHEHLHLTFGVLFFVTVMMISFMWESNVRGQYLDESHAREGRYSTMVRECVAAREANLETIRLLTKECLKK